MRHLGYPTALASVAAVSVLISLVEQYAHLANISMLYLVAVLATASAFGSGPAVLAAVAAFFTFNWFFVKPVHTLTVAEPSEWVTLVLFLVTAVVTGQLAAGQRRRATEAEQREQEAVLRARLQEQAAETEILRRADELKDALLNAVSHNLRTPLASIITWAGSLRSKDLAWSEVERREMAEAIEHEASRLNHIVGNLLDLSRIEGGGLKPAKEWHDLKSLVDDVAGRIGPVSDGHDLEVRVPDDLPPVPLDRVQIDQVLSNLVENAVKHTPSGTRVRISAESRVGEVEIAVEDTGPGIPGRAVARLFEPFFRDDGAPPGGVGLGLPVARGLVEGHGGRMWAEEGKGGARFVFTLPLTGLAAPKEEPAS